MKKENVSAIVFGGTGDLMRKKLFPAFLDLSKKGELGEMPLIVGLGRRDFSDEDYKNFLISGTNISKENIADVNLRYFKIDFESKNFLAKFSDFLVKSEISASNRLFYLATSYKFFSQIISELNRNDLLSFEEREVKILFEKPFGESELSFNKLSKEISKYVSEELVYRVDHYLAKDTVQNILIMKYANPFFDHILRGQFVEKIEVIVEEDMGVGDRIEYYDSVGAIKDMIQNHILQVLSLTIMDSSGLEADKIHDSKVKALNNLYLMPESNHLIGQYISYKSEAEKKGIKESRTETFAEIILGSKDKRWAGTKFILRTGKKLKRKYGQIKITFKNPDLNIMKSISGIENNEIIIDIYPKQDIRIVMNSRKPNTSIESVPIAFDFCKECLFGPNTSDEYSTLIGEAIKGDKMLFARNDELIACWKIVDKIEKMKSKIRFVRYADGENPD